MKIKKWNKRKPGYAAQLNYSSPLTNGLIAYYLFNENGGTQIFNSLGKYPVGTVLNNSTSVSNSWVNGTGGVAFTGSPVGGGFQYADLGFDSLFNFSQSMSFFMGINYNQSVLSGACFTGDRASNSSRSQGMLFVNAPSGNTFSLEYLNTNSSLGGDSIVSSSSVVTFTDSTIGFSRDSAALNVIIYINGENQGSGSYSNANMPLQSACSNRYLGAGYFAGSVNLGLTYWAAFWNRALGADEAQMLHFNPYDIIYPLVSRSVLLKPSFTCSIGAISLSAVGAFGAGPAFSVNIHAISQSSTSSLNVNASLLVHMSISSYYSTTQFHTIPLNTATITALSQHSTFVIHVINTIIALINNAMSQASTASFHASAASGPHIVAHSQASTISFHEITKFFVNVNVVSSHSTTQLDILGNIYGTITAISGSSVASFDAINQQNVTTGFGAVSAHSTGSFNVLTFAIAANVHAVSGSSVGSLNVNEITQPITTATIQGSSGSSTLSFHVGNYLGTNTFALISQSSVGSFSVNTFPSFVATIGAQSGSATVSFHSNVAFVGTIAAQSQAASASFHVTASLGISLGLQASNAATQFDALVSSGNMITAASQRATISFNIYNTYVCSITATSQSAIVSFHSLTGNINNLDLISSYSQASFNINNSTQIVMQIEGSITETLTYLQSKIYNQFVTQNLPLPSVVISILEYPPQTPGTPFIQLYPGSFSTYLPSVRGSGRNCTIIEGWIDVKIYVRNLLDVAYWDSDLIFTEDGQTGIYSVANIVYNAVQLCFPQDSAGNFVCSEPVRVKNIKKAKRIINSEEYAAIFIRLEVKIELILS